MKTEKKPFTDVAKANAYITSINEAHDALVEENKAAKASVAEAAKELKAVTTEYGKAQDYIGNFIDKADQEGSAVKKLEKDLLAANDVIADLGSQLQALSEISQSDKKIVTIKGKKFSIEGSNFIVPGKGEMTLEDLAADSKTLELLLEKGSSVLTAVNN